MSPCPLFSTSGMPFADLQAQEMYREPGGDFDPTRVLADGTVELGAGRYETVVHAGTEDGVPILTFTAPWLPETVAPQRPSARYLAMVGAGLRESHGWGTDRIVEYLRGCPGIVDRWRVPDLRALLAAP
ncbi:hypothetical protein [Nocardia mangyaensis]|uniref:hypothetical protein n=1 Tax=Nocardia mangyaensis TaxID=2213200 RepID=UPI00197E641D|nr:hypothetical protein [Nocardia mangyaensis]